MNNWSLSKILAGLHDDIEKRLASARKLFKHPGTKGDASERVWVDLFQKYLPQRYRTEKAHVVDSEGRFSDQIDVVVFDRQYTPLIFEYEGQKFIPAESVYAVFEAKQTINAKLIKYTKKKIASVRRLHRTALPITHAGGVYPPKPLNHIFGGILALDSNWKPALGKPLIKAFITNELEDRIDIGCIAAHGMFIYDDAKGYDIRAQGKSATAFLLEFIAQLQSVGTVPMIDTRAYARWLLA